MLFAAVLFAQLTQLAPLPPAGPVIWVLRRYQPWGTGIEAKFSTQEQCLRAKFYIDRRNHPLTTFECQQELAF